MSDHELSLLGLVVSIVAVGVGVVAFLWEFIYQPRKRIGFRVQMDTPVQGEPPTTDLGVLENLRPEPEPGESKEPLRNISIVLLKIENAGWTYIQRDDYESSVRIRFPGREVIGVAVTAVEGAGIDEALKGKHTGIADPEIEASNGIKTKLKDNSGVIYVPPVALRPRNHYKIMAVLRHRADRADDERAVEVLASVSGRTAKKTRSSAQPSALYGVLTVFLVAIIVAQLTISLVRKPQPEDCATGTLTLLGSSAFEPALRAAGHDYEQRCAGSHFVYNFQDSSEGLQSLAQLARPDALAFTDDTGNPDPSLARARPMAFTLFTLVVAKDFPVSNLSTPQVQDLFNGRVDNWNRIVPGLDLPVRLANRDLSSGTGKAFLDQVLHEPQPTLLTNSDACKIFSAPGDSYPMNCSRRVTKEELDTVAGTPGAIGYSGVAAANNRTDIKTVSIDGLAATRDNALDGKYRFGGTEYAYNYGPTQSPPDSLAAAFLRFLGFLAGKDIVSSFDSVPCGELADPRRCRPF